MDEDIKLNLVTDLIGTAVRVCSSYAASAALDILEGCGFAVRRGECMRAFEDNGGDISFFVNRAGGGHEEPYVSCHDYNALEKDGDLQEAYGGITVRPFAPFADWCENIVPPGTAILVDSEEEALDCLERLGRMGCLVERYLKAHPWWYRDKTCFWVHVEKGVNGNRRLVSDCDRTVLKAGCAREGVGVRFIAYSDLFPDMSVPLPAEPAEYPEAGPLPQVLSKTLRWVPGGDPDVLADDIVAKRRELGISCRELSRRTGIPYRVLSGLENPGEDTAPDAAAISALSPYIHGCYGIPDGDLWAAEVIVAISSMDHGEQERMMQILRAAFPKRFTDEDS